MKGGDHAQALTASRALGYTGRMGSIVPQNCVLKLKSRLFLQLLMGLQERERMHAVSGLRGAQTAENALSASSLRPHHRATPLCTDCQPHTQGLLQLFADEVPVCR